MAEKLKRVEGISNVIAHGDEYVKLTVGWIAIDFPQRALDETFKSMGYLKPAIHGADKIMKKRDGRRIFTFKKEDLAKVKPPSYINFGHYCFCVEYEGQEKTSSYCSETGHLVRDCHYRIQHQEQASNTSEEQSSHTTTDGTKFVENGKAAADTEDPDPALAESLQPR